MYLWSRHARPDPAVRVWHVALPLIVGGVAIPVALYLGSPSPAMIAVTHLRHRDLRRAAELLGAAHRTFLTGVAAAAGIALINSVGNLSGFAAPYITGWLADVTGSSGPGSGSSAGPWWRRPSSRSFFAPPLSRTRRSPADRIGGCRSR